MKKGKKIIIYNKKGRKIIIYSLKGSQGKTTIAAAIALELDWQIITNDIHSDLVQVVKEENVFVLEPGEELPSEKDLKGANIIFDPGGFVDDRMIEALKMSDLVVIPVVDLGRRDFETNRFVATVFEVEQYNKNIVFVLNMLDEKSTKIARECIKVLKTEHGYPYPVFELKRTEAFENMIREGVPVSTIAKKGALFKRWFKPLDTQFQKLVTYIKGGN